MQRMTDQEVRELNRALIQSLERLGKSIKRSGIQMPHDRVICLTGYVDVVCEVIDEQAAKIKRLQRKK